MQRVFGKNVVVEKTPLRDLELFTDSFNQKIVTFNDFVHRYPEANWVLDIKDESADATLLALSKAPFLAVLNERIPQQVKFLFWSARTERKFLRVFPGADTFARELQCWRAGLSAIAGFPQFGGLIAGKTYALPPTLCRKSLYNERIFSLYHRNSAKILAYLPESPALCALAIASGANYVIANADFFNNL